MVHLQSHTRSIKRCHFQWPWTTPNATFSDLKGPLLPISRSHHHL